MTAGLKTFTTVALVTVALVVVTLSSAAAAEEGRFASAGSILDPALVPPSGQPQVPPPAFSSGPEDTATEKPLTLRRNANSDLAGNRNFKSGSSLYTVLGSLGLVLGIFFAAMWFFKRGMPNSYLALPREAFEVFGHAAIGPRQQVELVRIGDRLLLVAVSQAGLQTLTEIKDPREIERLARLCKRETVEVGRSPDDVVPQRTSRSRHFRKSRQDDEPSTFEPAYTGGRDA